MLRNLPLTGLVKFRFSLEYLDKKDFNVLFYDFFKNQEPNKSMRTAIYSESNDDFEYGTVFVGWRYQFFVNDNCAEGIVSENTLKIIQYLFNFMNFVKVTNKEYTRVYDLDDNEYLELLNNHLDEISTWFIEHPGKNGLDWAKENRLYRDYGDEEFHDNDVDVLFADGICNTLAFAKNS